MAKKLKPDRVLFVVTLALVAFGIAMVFSSSAVVAKEKFGDPNYAQLNQVWSSPDKFLDLPKSSSDAAWYYQARDGYATEKLFWSQFGASKRPLLLNE